MVKHPKTAPRKIEGKPSLRPTDIPKGLPLAVFMLPLRERARDYGVPRSPHLRLELGGSLPPCGARG